MDTDDLSKKKMPGIYRAPTAEMLAYLDFSVSTTGMLAGKKIQKTILVHAQESVNDFFRNQDVSRFDDSLVQSDETAV